MHVKCKVEADVDEATSEDGIPSSDYDTDTSDNDLVEELEAVTASTSSKKLNLENVFSIKEHPKYRANMSYKEKERLKYEIKAFHAVHPHDAGWAKTPWVTRKWADKDIENGFILLHMVSTRIYDYIREKKWFPLPGHTVITRALKNVSLFSV